MNNLKNLAGNDVSIFLFRFVLHGNGIDFVLNEAIAADMYQDVDEKIKPLVHACCETLLRYRHLKQLLENLSRKDVAPIRGYPYNLRAYDGFFVIFVVVYMKEYPYADTSTPIS